MDRFRICIMLICLLGLTTDLVGSDKVARLKLRQSKSGSPPAVIEGVVKRRNAAPKVDDSHTVWGIVTELRSGTPDVVVCLCDGASGLPVDKNTYQPLNWSLNQAHQNPKRMAIVQTDKGGKFRFEKVPDGRYRVVAQKWSGPYKGAFEEHGTVIQLMGTASNVVVPRPDEYYEAMVALRPPGRGIVQIDQKVPNSDTFLFLSTQPAEFDPILGLYAPGSTFFQHLVGINRMPLGQTTVIGVPDKPLYGFLFAPDNSPGYVQLTIQPSPTGFTQVPAEPFIAGWSNGRKTPPPDLAKLATFLEAHSLSAAQVLKLPKLNKDNAVAFRDRMLELTSNLSKQVQLPENQTARVGDLLAVQAYQRLQR